ncbi:hypothetical protein CVS40_4642 [Lucilia cuprina]|nr:hypothetical protein CVS40_4642 [Lucilia cuprina]
MGLLITRDDGVSPDNITTFYKQPSCHIIDKLLRQQPTSETANVCHRLASGLQKDAFQIVDKSG